MHVIAAKAVAFKEALEPAFKTYQQAVIDNAKAMAMTFVERGYHVISGGTDNHLCLIDLTPQDITGKDAEAVLGLANITVNKNTVPGETRSPFVTSGLRVGTPAITTRGFGVKEATTLTHWMCDLLDNISDEALPKKIQEDVIALCRQFPVYQNLNT